MYGLVTRYGPQSVASATWLISPEFFAPNCNSFSVSSIFNRKQNKDKQVINFLLLNNFYPVISYRRVQTESDELSCTVWSFVMVRNQLPAQVIEIRL